MLGMQIYSRRVWNTALSRPFSENERVGKGLVKERVNKDFCRRVGTECRHRLFGL